MTSFVGTPGAPDMPIPRLDDEDCESLAAVLLELDDDDEWESPDGGGSSRWRSVSFAYVEDSESAQMEEIANSLRAARVIFSTIGQSVNPERMLHEGRWRTIVSVGFSLPLGSPWCFEVGEPRDPGTWLHSREFAVAPDSLAWRIPLRSGHPPRLAAAANTQGPTFHKLEVQHAHPTSETPEMDIRAEQDRILAMEMGLAAHLGSLHWPTRPD